jgi:hypothetical protein
VVSFVEKKVKPLWLPLWLVAFVAPHLSNVDVLSLTRKELREYIFVSSLRLSLTLPLLLAPNYLYCVFAHIGLFI